MSSHREAPAISRDPVADSTDLYAFVSPDAPDTVTLIANYVPLEAPAGGPNFYEFGDDVLYEIKVDNDADGDARHLDPVPVHHPPAEHGDLPLQHRADHEPGRHDLESVPDIRRRLGPGRPFDHDREEPRSARRSTSARCRRRTTRPLPRPPSTRSPTASRSSPASAVTASTWTSARSSTLATFGRSRTSIFRGLSAAPGVDALKTSNVHSIAIQVPKSMLTHDHRKPTDASAASSVIGIYDVREPPEGPRSRGRRPGRDRTVGPGLAPGQPARQRGHHPDGPQGQLERAAAVGRQPVQQVRPPPGAGGAAARALSGRLPEPRGLLEAAGRPRRDPA